MALEFKPLPYLGRAEATLDVLHRHHMTANKRYGQNFLIDERVIQKIIEISEIGYDDFVLEIGPGIGTLTQYLASAAGEVVCVELDEKLLPVLEDTLQLWKNVQIIQGDILKTDINAIAAGRKLKVVANLPYYITTPILLKLLEEDLPISLITVMVQKEVADRMQARPGCKDYGALSLAVQYHSKAQVRQIVPPHCFIPRPKVESAVVRLDRYEENPVVVSDEAHLFRVIRASFNQRRKTLVNGILNAGCFPVSREDLLEILDEMQLPATIRGEALSLEQFAAFSEHILARKKSR